MTTGDRRPCTGTPEWAAAGDDEDAGDNNNDNNNNKEAREFIELDNEWRAAAGAVSV
jgi:hypothetical protein